MRLATIDLGSNTVRLLIADVEPGGAAWRVVEQDQRVTRLGEGLTGSGRLGPAAAARTVATVAEYVGRARRAAADRIRIVATSAVREAADGVAFVAEVERRTGQPVSVISGDEEARLTLRGVLHGLGTTGASPGGSMLVFDVGGGSTEYILARGDRVIAAVSLTLGVVPLAERFPFPGPVDRDRYRAMSAEIAGRLARELPAAIREAAPDRLVGTAGTVTTLAALDLRLVTYDPLRVQGHVLTRGAVQQLLARLGALALTERAALPCLEPGRADLIVAGAAIVLETMACCRADRLVVSDFGLREGLLIDLQ